jgi:hypothetical protein
MAQYLFYGTAFVNEVKVGLRVKMQIIHYKGKYTHVFKDCDFFVTESLINNNLVLYAIHSTVYNIVHILTAIE